MFHTLDISTSALVAQRQRMNTIAGNLANISSTRDEHGEVAPFQRRLISFMAQQADKDRPDQGVGVDFQVEVDADADPRLVFQPGHPDANPEGFVAFPNINPTLEFVNAIEASRAYEANIATLDMSKQMFQQTLRILA